VVDLDVGNSEDALISVLWMPVRHENVDRQIRQSLLSVFRCMRE